MALSTINTVCHLEDFLSPAPASVAILGQLMAIATTIDFSIAKNEPRNGFKFVKYPDSFRACLVQISTSGCDAFTNAHTNMDQIRLYTMQFQGNVKDLVKVVLKGSPEDKMTIAPIFLEEIKKQANKCLELATKTQSDFSKLTELLVEVSLAATAAKGLHETKLAETTQQSKILKQRQELVKHQQAEIQKTKEEVIEKVSAATAALAKSEEEMPSPTKIMLLNTWDQGLKVASTCTSIFAISQLANPVGIAAIVVKGVVDVGKYVSKKSEKLSQKRDENKALQIAFKNASEIHALNILLRVMIEKISSQEPAVDQPIQNKPEDQKGVGKHNQKTENQDIEVIHEKMKTFLNELQNSEFVNNQKVQDTMQLCKRSIAVCLLTKTTTGSNTNQWKNMLSEMHLIVEEAETLKTLADNYICPGSASRIVEASKESNGLAQQVTDSLLYKVESKRQELDYMRKKQESVTEKARELDQKHTKILEDLLKTDLKTINFEDIIDTLSKGMHTLGEIDEQWRMLVLFFSIITSRIDICLLQQTDTFKKISHKTGHQINAGNKEIILEIAASINAVAYSVGLVAETYTDISAKYLVQTTAGLVKMIALHPERDEEELEFRRKDLNDNCAKAQQKIRELAAERREMALRHVREQFEKIKLLESKMPAIKEERKKKIREDVAKSVEMMCIDDLDESDYI